MKAFLYKMTCLTNLHVGNEGGSYSVIDKEVEKDVNGYPVIHASGLKGALRSQVKAADDANKLFGTASNANGNQGKGEYSFTDAMLLYRPLRTAGTDRASIPVITKDTISELMNLTEAFCCKPEGLDQVDLDSINFDDMEFLTTVSDMRVEDEEATGVLNAGLSKSLKKIVGGDFAIAKNMGDYPLPTIARNNLDPNHRNLWFEEYVPHGSCFFAIILTPDGVEKPALDLDRPVQIGGNASVGYGFVKMELWGESK